MPQQVSNFERVLGDDIKYGKKFLKTSFGCEDDILKDHQISKNSNKMAENTKFTAP